MNLNTFNFEKNHLVERILNLLNSGLIRGKKAEWGSVVYERVKNRLNIFDNSFLSITFVE